MSDKELIDIIENKNISGYMKNFNLNPKRNINNIKKALMYVGSVISPMVLYKNN